MFLGILESPEPVLFTRINEKSRESNGQVWASLECRPGALLPLTEVYTIQPSYELEFRFLKNEPKCHALDPFWFCF